MREQLLELATVTMRFENPRVSRPQREDHMEQGTDQEMQLH